jgi:hypothetical protein
VIAVEIDRAPQSELDAAGGHFSVASKAKVEPFAELITMSPTVACSSRSAFTYPVFRSSGSVNAARDGRSCRLYWSGAG